MHIELTGEVEPDAIHQCSGLERLAGGHDLLERHAGFDAKTFLRDDWPLIEVHAHEVRRDTGNFHAVLVRLPIRLRPRKTGQQRRMNVNDLVFEPTNEIGLQDFHEARQHDKIHLGLLENLQHFLLRLGSVRPRHMVER